MERVGSLWTNTKDNKKFLTGELNLGVLGKVKIGIFPNDKKKKNNEPDFNIITFDK